VVLITTALLCIAVLGSAAAQDNDMAGRKGLTASLQSSQLDIMVPIWVGGKTVVAPVIQFTKISDAVTDYGFGLAFRSYFNQNETRPYLGLRAAMMTWKPEEGDSTTDTVFGAFFGGEHFLDDDFSVGIEAQVNISVSDEHSNRFGNPDGTNINTATALLATLYF
jgi:hypothetical protein